MCDKEDIELIKSVAGVKDEKIVVRVDDAFVSYENFKYLLSCPAFLNGDVSIHVHTTHGFAFLSTLACSYSHV